MITELTKKQEDMLQVYADRYIKKGLSTHEGVQDINKEELEQAFRDAYKVAGLEAPTEFYYVDNPIKGAIKANFLMSGKMPKVGDRLEVPSCGYGSFDADVIAKDMFYYEQLGIKEAEAILPLAKITDLSGWWWPLTSAVVVCPKPSEIKLDNEGRLHNPNGPAVSYSGKGMVYAMRGVVFTDEYVQFITKPAENITAEEVMGIEDVNIRALVIDKVGLDKVYSQCDAKLLHQDTIVDGSGKAHNYELVSLMLPGDDQRVTALKMINPSTGDIHVEGVEDSHITVKQALHWRVFKEELKREEDYVAPMRLT